LRLVSAAEGGAPLYPKDAHFCLKRLMMPMAVAFHIFKWWFQFLLDWM
jgi:hypothetical protein